MGERLGPQLPVRALLGATFGVAAVCLGAAALAQALLHAPVLPRLGTGEVTAVLLALTAGLFLVSGALRLTRWRLVRDRRSALLGSALVVLGGVSLPLGGLAHLVAPPAGSLSGPLLRTVATVVAMALLLRALDGRREPREHALRPGLYLPRLLAALGGCFLVLVLVDRWLEPSLGAVLALGALRVSGWAVLAVVALRRAGQASRAPGSAWAGRAAPLMVAMGVAEVFRVLDRGAVGPWTMAALLVCATLGAISTHTALVELDEAMCTQDDRVAGLTVALDEAQDRSAELHRWREQVAHDARGAVAGLRAALTVLEQLDEDADPLAAARLRLAAVDEIAHIEHLLERRQPEPPQAFEVHALLRSVATGASALGLGVSVAPGVAVALGRPADLAAIVRNLLGNARVHAPGSPVRLAVRVVGDRVRVECRDSGPGVDPAEADLVFERGHRGAASPGQGLGLHGARVLARELGGDLVLEPNTGPGACFVVLLPAAVPAPVRLPDQRRPAVEPVLEAG